MQTKELITARKLFNKSKFEDVLDLLDNVDKPEDLVNLDKIMYYLLKSSLFFRYRKDEQCIKYAEIALRESKNLGYALYTIDALLNISWAALWLGDFSKALNSISRSENLLKTLPNIKISEHERREAFIYFIMACTAWFKADKNGLDLARKSLEIRQRLGIKHEVVESYSIICGYSTYFREDLDNTLELLKSCHKLSIEINHPWTYTFNPKNFGEIYYLKGDLKKALFYYKKAVLAFEKDNLLPTISTISEIGNIYKEMGDLNQCCNFLKRSYRIAVNTNNNWLKSEIMANLIEVLVIRGNFKHAEKY
ncbi:MAG: tetratricopeptide repeat protein, partial [Promethearchaeota archaeon]